MLEDLTEQDLKTIAVSGPPIEPHVERRRHARQVTVLRVAKLYTPAGEELCLVRNISAGGMMAHLYSDLAINTVVTVEFKSGWVVPARVLWRRDDLGGMRFNQPVDCDDLLSGATTMPFHHRARAPRINLEVRARIRVDADYHSVTLHNIAQGGANIACSAALTLGDGLVLMVPGLVPLTGTVCWQRDGHAGITFDNPVSLEVLGRWVTMMRSRLPGQGGDSGTVTPMLAPPHQP
jgi:hypothetical protein